METPELPRDILGLIAGYMTSAPDIRSFKLVSRRWNSASYDGITHLLMKIRPLWPVVKEGKERNLEFWCHRDGCSIVSYDDHKHEKLPPFTWLEKHRFLEVIDYPFTQSVIDGTNSLFNKLRRIRHVAINNNGPRIDIDIFKQWPSIRSIVIATTDGKICDQWEISSGEIFMMLLRDEEHLEILVKCKREYGGDRANLFIYHFLLHEEDLVKRLNDLNFSEIHINRYCQGSLFEKVRNVKSLKIMDEFPQLEDILDFEDPEDLMEPIDD